MIYSDMKRIGIIHYILDEHILSDLRESYDRAQIMNNYFFG